MVLEYLLSLVSSRENFELKKFELLLASRPMGRDQLCIKNCVLQLLSLLDNNKKLLQTSCDIGLAICHLSFNNAEDARSFFCSNLNSQCSQIQGISLRSNASIVLAGSMRYLCFKKYILDHEFILQCKLYLYQLLQKSDELTATVFISEYFLKLVDVSVISADQLNIVTSAVMSVVLNYWNHPLSEVRFRIKNLSLTCLRLHYAQSTERYSNSLKTAVNLKLFKVFAQDIFWNLPYKYFAFLVGLEFVSEISNVTKYLMYVQADVREGFSRSLQNTRVIAVEIELFKYCTKVLSYEDWCKIFNPIIDAIIETENKVVSNNFSRYWLPVIVMKFPDFASSLWHKLKPVSPRSASQSRMLFALLKNSSRCKIKLLSIENLDQRLKFLRECFKESEETRGELFSLLCNLDDQSVPISKDEFQSILEFLSANCQSTNTAFRLQIFSSFAQFILRLLCSSIKILKTNLDEADDLLAPTLEFLNSFCNFVFDNIRPGSSHQRKITSLTLYKILMAYANGGQDDLNKKKFTAYVDNGSSFRKNNLGNTNSVILFAKLHQSWPFTSPKMFQVLFQCLMDPCSEFHTLSFFLLRTYFSLHMVELAPALFSDLMLMLKNNHFYKRQSATAAVQCLICLSYNSKSDSALDTLLAKVPPEFTTFIEIFIAVLEQQTEVLKEDMLNSALFEPISGTVRVLTFLMTSESSPEFEFVTRRQIENLIKILEVTVPLLLKALFLDDFKDYAPSFEESDLALHGIIKNSSILNQEINRVDESEIHLQPTYQILLNYVWISLKACCECESQLIVAKTQLLGPSLIIRCSDLVVMKLKLCRHKGVIESAALALSQIVDKMTLSQICDDWLEEVLSDIIQLIEFKSSTTISRKSGGLSLLVQNIAGNDRRNGKPLLRRCWEEFRRILNVDFETLYSKTSEELPQTHALHLLRVIVGDARNSYELKDYFEEICILCLRSLKTSIWTVRNASLQLFGAILSKIVGQKNSLNDTGVRRSFEEIFDTMPSLLEYIAKDLERSTNVSRTRLTVAHSDLVPILVLLSNIQIGSINIMQTTQKVTVLKLRFHIRGLFSSGLYFVRKLACKAFISLHSRTEMSVFKKINHEVIDMLKSRHMGNLRENELHGLLMTLHHAFLTQSSVTSFSRNLHPYFSVECASGDLHVSLISEGLIYKLNIMSTQENSIDRVRKVFDLLADRRYCLIGFDDWALAVQNAALSTSTDPVQVIKKMVSSNSEFLVENLLRVFTNILCEKKDIDRERIDTYKYKFRDVAHIFCEVLEVWIRAPDSTIKISILNSTFQNLILVSDQISKVRIEFLEENYERLNNLNRFHYQALNLYALSIFMKRCKYEKVDEILKNVYDTLHSKLFERDARLNGAKTTLELCDYIFKLEINNERLWLSLVHLLIDEEDEIRNIACECVQKLRESAYLLSPDETLVLIFSPNFLTHSFTVEQAIIILEKIIYDVEMLQDCLLEDDRFKSKIIYYNEDVSNPFDQKSNNVFKESSKLLKLIGSSLILLITDHNGRKFARKLDQQYIEIIERNLVRFIENKYLITDTGYAIGLNLYFVLKIDTALSNKQMYDSCLTFENVFMLPVVNFYKS